MRPFAEQNRGSVALDDCRLETPAMVGYRFGMSSSGVIGRKLSAVYGVANELPREMDRAIRQLHDRLDSDV